MSRQPATPAQQEMPFAIVQGTPITEPPRDLYIPPDALEVFLEAFAGPLDLLLYLIRRQNIDITDIPIARITEQYMAYIELMQEMKIELAAEYLVMAAMLAEIKSRLLLPRPVSEDEEEEADPRAELVRRLQQYERYRQAAEDLSRLPRLERDLHPAHAEAGAREVVRTWPPVALDAVLAAMADVLRRLELNAEHRVQREPLSVRERMALVLERAGKGEFVEFVRLFDPEEGRAGVVVVLLAVLELLREALIELVQHEYAGPIYVRAVR